MLTIQEYFNQTEPKNRINIFIEGNKIGKTEGHMLIIEDYPQLETIYISDLPNLTQLTIKNCPQLESLELHLDKEIEVILRGDYPKLKNFKSISTQQHPVVVKHDCKCGGLRTFFEIILIFLNILLLGYIYWEKRRKNKNKSGKNKT